MTQEKKAKAYDDLLVKLQKAKVDNDVCDERYCCVIDSIVPELKESGDEEIRKWIIKGIQETLDVDGFFEVQKTMAKKALAWLEKQGESFTKKDVDDAYLKGICDAKHELEKQGEQEHVIAPKFDIGDTIRNKITNEVFTITDRCILLEYYHDINHLHEVKFSEQNNWELVKQKPADKVEPKFKVGNWVACEELNTARIVNINDDKYEVEFIDGNKGFPHIDYVDRNFHLWTIRDAKDGDVLAAHECYVIFKEIDGLNIKCHCTYHYMYFNPSFYVDTLQNKDAFYPATKEQRDLLFAKMKKAGYEWDAEKKELKKIEQKPAWSEEDKEMFGYLEDIVTFCYRNQYVVNVQTCESVRQFLFRLKSLCFQSTWNKDDIARINEIIETLNIVQANRVRTQRMHYNKATIDKDIDWLKSLGPQSHWKPSDEQMIELHRVISGCSYDIEQLVELETKLKEL